MSEILFTPVQLLALLGMTQALYALVYMAFRAGRLSRAGLAIVYFFVLFCGFFYDFGMPFFEGFISAQIQHLSWALWIVLPSLSYLLVLQISHIRKTPSISHYLVLLLPVFAVSIGYNSLDVLYLLGVFSGAVSLLLVWLKKDTLQDVWKNGKAGRPRYWLIICLLSANVILLVVLFLGLIESLKGGSLLLVRNVLGVAFVYLASTSLFRIYPQAVLIKEKRSLNLDNKMNRDAVDALEALLVVDRVYQEPQYGRKNFAQELGVSEATISKIINDQYGQTVPQLLNQYRIEEAKGLLKDTNASIQVIASEVGFHSLTTFNRVFRDVVGRTPTQFKRKK
jgi:AraC-like DNA-binding protein